MILYNLKSIPGPEHKFIITKFDDDFNPGPVYIVGRDTCDCPAGVRDTCRHRKMLPLMLDRVDSHWFYCFDDKQWYDPTGAAQANDDWRYVVSIASVDVIGAPAPDLTNNPPTIKIPPLLPDQKEYLQEIQDATGKYNPNTMVGGPDTKLRRLR